MLLDFSLLKKTPENTRDSQESKEMNHRINPKFSLKAQIPRLKLSNFANIM